MRPLLAILVGLTGSAFGCVAASHGAAATPPANAARRVPVPARAFVGEGCTARTAVPRVAYDLGRGFDGFVAGRPEYVCNAAPPRPREVANGPTISWGFVSREYGTCDTADGDCWPPLDIQSAPECALNPRSYEANPGFHESPEERELTGGLVPRRRLILRAAPWLPAQSFEAGRRIELYAGGTTVVVVATSARLARAAAHSLARYIGRLFPASTRASLQRDAKEPGDGRACHRFRGQL